MSGSNLYEHLNWHNQQLLRGRTIYFGTSGTFLKNNYPGLKAVFFKLQAAGGSGSGCSANNPRVGGGGGGGEYAEGFFLVDDIPTSCDIVVPGPTSAPAAGNSTGNTGATARVGPNDANVLLTALGGGGGADHSTNLHVQGGGGGNGGATHANALSVMRIQGGGGESGWRNATDVLVRPQGGGSYTSPGKGGRPANSNASGDGGPGGLYGAGGAGAFQQSGTTANRAGGAGAQGLVWMELFW